MRKPKYNGNWHVIQYDNGIWLFNVLTSKQFILKENPNVIKGLLRLCNGNKTTDEIIRQFKSMYPTVKNEQINHIMETLIKHHIILENDIENDLGDEYMIGYERNIEFFSEFETNNITRFEYQKRLRNAKVIIIGVGGIGATVVQTLISVGVGNITVVDFDIVERKNLPRQPIYRISDLGIRKVDAIKNQINQIKPEVVVNTINKKITSVEDVKEVIVGHNLVIQACDSPRFLIRRWINEACIKTKIDFLMVHSCMIGPLVIPGKTACNTCLEDYIRKSFPLYDQLVKEIINSSYHRPMPFIGPMVMLSGVIAGMEAIKYITQYTKPITLNRVITVNPVSGEIRIVRIKRNKYCATCGNVN